MFRTSPNLKKKIEDISVKEISRAWEKWLITDDVLKKKKNWQDYIDAGLLESVLPTHCTLDVLRNPLCPGN